MWGLWVWSPPESQQDDNNLIIRELSFFCWQKLREQRKRVQHCYTLREKKQLKIVGVTRLERATTWSQTRYTTNCATPRFCECKITIIFWNMQIAAYFFSFFAKKLVIWKLFCTFAYIFSRTNQNDYDFTDVLIRATGFAQNSRTDIKRLPRPANAD